MTPMGSRSLLMRRSRLLAEPPQRGGDRDQLLGVHGARERVVDVVGAPSGLPGDEPDAAAVVVDVELAAVDRARVVRAVEDRRLAPLHPLDAVVLARDAEADD